MPFHSKSEVPKEPKNAFGPFHFFLADFRSEVKKSKTVVIEPKDMIKKCTERWHQMKEREKMKYKIMSMADHRRAKYEWKIFNNRCKEEKVEVNKPKRCRGALMWFIQEKSKEKSNTKLKWGEHLKILHQQFKDLSDEERRPYVEMEEKDRKRKREEVKKIKQEKRKSKPKKVKKKGATFIPHERITSNEFVSDSDSE